MASEATNFWKRIDFLYQNRERMLVRYREKLVEALSLRMAKVWGISSFEEEFLPLRLRTNVQINSAQRKNDDEASEIEIDLETALQEKCLFLLLGAPGSGKTTILRYLAILSGRGLIPGVPNLPVLISPRFAKDEKEYAIENAIQRELAAYGGASLKNDELRKLLNQGRFLVLFDGLDETEDTIAAAQKILQFSRTYNKCHFIVTARNIPDKEYVTFQLFGFANLSIQPLNDAEIRHFINSWSVNHKVSAEIFWSKLQENSSLLSLGRNPLMLRLMLVQYSEQTKQPIRADRLTDISIHAILAPSYQQLPDLVHQLAEQVAFFMSVHKQHTFTLEDIAKQTMPAASDYSDLRELEETLKTLCESKILIEIEQEKYNFRHLLIQEYLCAQYIKKMDTNQLVDLCRQWAGDEMWKTILTLSLRERPDVVDIVKKLLSSDSSDQWLIAANCLRGNTKENVYLKMMTIQKLCDVLNMDTPIQTLRISNALAQDRESINYCQHMLFKKENDSLVNASLAYILAAQGFQQKEVYDALLRTVRDRNASVRYQSCRALGAIGTESSIEILIEGLKGEENDEVLQQILLELERIEDLPKHISSSTLAVLNAELKRRFYNSSNPNIKLQIEQVINQITGDVLSKEVR